MTLRDARRRVLMLLDEYSSGGEITIDQDIENKMADFFDIAQKEIASVKKIVRTKEYELHPSKEYFSYYDLPDNFSSIFRLWKNGKEISGVTVIGNKLSIPSNESGTVLLEYFAFPSTITPDTPDDYEFEVSEDAANCLPFYVAAQHLIPDLVVDWSSFWSMYVNMRGALDTSLHSTGTASYISQRLYRG